MRIQTKLWMTIGVLIAIVVAILIATGTLNIFVGWAHTKR